MRVEIYHNEKLIGCSELDAADPPMGVAAGPFEPGPGYEREIHAGEIEGFHRTCGADLDYVVKSTDHGLIDCQGVFIRDYSEVLGERQVCVLGIGYPDYETFFGEYPAFKAYWGKD